MAPALKVRTKYEVKPWDRIPVVLRAISGFNSCLTVSVMSVVFIWSVHLSVTTGKASWPEFMTGLLMIIGPIIITINFVNAKSIISTIVGVTDEVEGRPAGDGAVLPAQPSVVVAPAPGIVSQHDIAFEREIVGPTTVLLRAIAGTISTHVICFCSLLFTWTIHDSMIGGHPLPGDGQLFMIVIGPIITSWNFVRANATLNAVIKGTSAINVWRDRLASMLSTKS
jgi:hypothetical protein